MKKFTQLFSSLLALSLILSFSVFSASATEENRQINQENALKAAMMAADDYQVSYYGNIKVTSATLPLDVVHNIQSATRSYMIYSGTATDFEDGEFTFTCSDGRGTTCNIQVENTDDSDSMDYSLSWRLNGERGSGNTTIRPGKGWYKLIESTSGEDLSGFAEATITPTQSGTAVDWEATAQQY